MYWLFTEGRELVSGLLPVLLCITPILILISAAVMGVSIRRTGEEALKPSYLQRGVTVLSYGLVMLTVSSAYVSLVGDMAVRRGRSTTTPVIRLLTGASPHIDANRLFLFGVMGAFLVAMSVIVLHSLIREGGWLRERLDRLRVPPVKRGALGSSHFCTPREYRRFRRPDADGLTLLGAFWGAGKRRLDFGRGQFCLSGEDIARGVLTLGSAGSGKTQAIILPAIADRMRTGHSLIVADPQGELMAHIQRIAAVTRHLVVIHDPTSAAGPRYNLAADIRTVSDARAIAEVLVPPAHGDHRFWSDSAAALLSACLIRFDTLGAIYQAMNDPKSLATTLKSKRDDAALLANSFNASVNTDGKVAANVIATLATALTGWASADVRANTSASDFDAELLTGGRTVVVLTCPGRMRAVYASYLGATLRKLMLDLDTLGERHGGALPVPVGIVLDEFPTLGRLDGLVADVNLVRKRRISIVIGAQTKGQFHLIYGAEGTAALFTGLATQVIYGGCDAETAEFYSRVSGTATADDANTHLRQRPLLTVDEVITPQVGNCTVFARYVEAGHAAQVILNARLTRFYEREDWRARLNAERTDPLLLERGVSLNFSADAPPDEAKHNEVLETAARAALAREREWHTEQEITP